MFKTINDGILPTRATKFSACVDVYANEDVFIGAGETKVIGLGVCIDLVKLKPLLQEKLSFFNVASFGTLNKETIFEQFLKSHYLQLMLRSSLGVKGLVLPNGIGIIDLDYKDEIKMIIHNPIINIDREIPFDKEDDYIELGYMGVSDNKKYVCGDRYKIKKGDRIGQITILEHKSHLFGICSENDRDGGFGSTGK